MRPAPVGARLDDATAACWLRHIPISPYHFHMTLFDEIIGGERCIVAIDEDGNGGFRFSVEEGERVVLEGHRYWSLASGYIFHGMIRADMRREDQMLPTRVLRNSFELYHELAIQEVYLSAGYERGGYVWAKFGFMPESKSSWNKLAKQLRKRLSKIKNKMSKNGFDYVFYKLESDDPYTIWEISDLNERVETVKLGYYLLAGSTWRGKISLQDNLAVDRFNSYLRQKNLRTLSW